MIINAIWDDRERGKERERERGVNYKSRKQITGGEDAFEKGSNDQKDEIWWSITWIRQGLKSKRNEERKRHLQKQ